VKNNDGNTALHIAAMRNKPDICVYFEDLINDVKNSKDL